MTETERGAAALNLWRELLSDPDFGSPLINNDETGDEWCYFCSAPVIRGIKFEHEPDCVYIRARKLVEADNER